jgi:hypothetical protein
VKAVIRNNKAEINHLKQAVEAKWDEKLGGLKDEVSRLIQNATDEQLNHPHQLLGNIQAEIDNFLGQEFQRAEQQVQNSITQDLSRIQLPAPIQQAKFSVDNLTRWGKNFNVPPQIASLGMLAISFFTASNIIFWLPPAAIIVIVSPLINKIFEQLKIAGVGIGTSVFKTQLQKKINEQWSVIDESVRDKIDEFFRALSEHMEHLGRKTVSIVMGEEENRVALSNRFTNRDQIKYIEAYKDQLGNIVG